MAVSNLRLLDSPAPEGSGAANSNIAEIIVYVFFAVGLIALAGFIVYDRRQEYSRLICVRQNIWMIWRKAKGVAEKLKKKHKKDGEKVNGEEQPNSSKATLGVLQNEKTFADSDITSIQETENTTPALSEEFREMHLQDDTPQVDLKEMFEKDKRGKDKAKGKSKSKLRGRIQIKKSELQAEANEEENPCDLSQELQKSVDATEQ